MLVRLLRILLAFFLASSIASAQSTIFERISSDASGRFTTLIDLLERTSTVGLVDILNSTTSSVTLFAPTDDLFALLPPTTLTFLRDPVNEPLLSILLGYHVMFGVIDFFNFLNLPNQDFLFLTSILGYPSFAFLDTGTIPNPFVVTDFEVFGVVVDPDISASNGAIQAIDNILFPPSIGSFVAFFSDFSTIQGLINQYGLGDILLDNTISITFFAPANAAFLATSLPFDTLDERFFVHTIQLVLNQIAPGALDQSNIFNGTADSIPVVSFAGLAPVDQATMTVGGASIESADIAFFNGVLHIVDRVLVPPTYNVGLTTFSNLVQDFSITYDLLIRSQLGPVLDVVGPLTLFAPVNSAWNPALVTFLQDPQNILLLQFIILNHVLPFNLYFVADGSTPNSGFIVDSAVDISLFFYASGPNTTFVNQAEVFFGSFLSLTGNGVIYAITQVLLPQGSEAIVANFSNFDLGVSLTTLSGALTSTGVISNLVSTGSGLATLFAPTDAAFATIPSRYLTSEFSGHTRNIVENHVVDGFLNLTSLLDAGTVTTLTGAQFTFQNNTSGTLVVGGTADVIIFDVFTSDGVVHVINNVLLPNYMSIEQLVQSDPNLSILAEFISLSGLSSRLADTQDGPFTLFAPTNAAFVAAGLSSAASETTESAAAIIRSHITNMNNYVSGLVDGQSLTTLNPQDPISVSVMPGMTTGPMMIRLDGVADLDLPRSNQLAANGVVHIISSVLSVVGDTMPTAAPTSRPGFMICFSGASTVVVLDKGPTPMRDLRIGDKVQTVGGKYETVYGFGHHDDERTAKYLRLYYHNKESGHSNVLEISEQHMVFVEGIAVPASSVKTGDRLTLVSSRSNNETALVSDVDVMIGKGMYAPLTPSGTIAVNGVLASCFVVLQAGSKNLVVGAFSTGLSYHWIARGFEAPHRLVCHHFGRSCPNEVYVEGVSSWMYFPMKAATWVLRQNAIVVGLAALASAVFPAAFLLLESLLTSPHAMVSLVTAMIIGQWFLLGSRRRHQTKML